MAPFADFGRQRMVCLVLCQTHLLMPLPPAVLSQEVSCGLVCSAADDADAVGRRFVCLVLLQVVLQRGCLQPGRRQLRRVFLVADVWFQGDGPDVEH